MVQGIETPPDVIGRLLPEARMILRKADWSIASIILTKSSKHKGYINESLRVAQQTVIGERQIVLTVVYDLYKKV